MGKKISVIVPVYNVESYLTRCLNSLIAQTYPLLEIILIDDGSTDNSGKICDHYGELDPRIVVVHQSNSGVSVARNVGLEHCTGDYISFVDADDWLEPDMYSVLIDVCRDIAPDMIVCKADNVAIDDLGNIEHKTRSSWNKITEPLILNSSGIYYNIFSCSVVLWNKIFRRDVIGKARFDVGKSYGEDFLFLLKVFPDIQKAVLVPEVLYHYFSSRPGNVVSAELDNRSKEMLQNAKKAYVVLNNRGYSDLAVHRLLVAVSEVFAKFDYKKKAWKEHSDYLLIICDLVHTPERNEVMAFLQSEHYSIKEKFKFIALRTSPSVYLALYKACVSIRNWRANGL